MTDHGRVNLRAGMPRGMFATEEASARYLRDCERQRDDMRSRGVRFACGPAPMTFVSPSGRVFTSGETITAADLHGGDKPAWCLLEQALLSSRIIEAEGSK